MDQPMIFLMMLSILLSFSSASVVDFCVADLNYPVGPAGFPCKNPATLTSNDFVFSGFSVAGNTSNSIFKSAITKANHHTFPALNGLGISISRLDLAVGGIAPLHTHRADEMVLVIEGTIISGFIASDNTAYYKTMNKGDIMILPQSLLHFQINIGDIPAVLFVSLNSPSPGFQFLPLSLGSNNLPSEIIEKTTLLDPQQVKKLKNVFRGTN
ncbi:auxin-binding protein ABP19b-like [Silene latifolia]|uniref:auxin-binding protein ABP19b-like n=1 Tax=Silene latifolia TaxID=37657 RepID=UPI003D775FC3